VKTSSALPNSLFVSNMQTNFQLEGTAQCNPDEDDWQSEHDKPICVTVALLVPKTGKNRKATRKPDGVQKQFRRTSLEVTLKSTH
jgi:hypothetical protein